VLQGVRWGLVTGSSCLMDPPPLWQARQHIQRQQHRAAPVSRGQPPEMGRTDCVLTDSSFHCTMHTY